MNLKDLIKIDFHKIFFTLLLMPLIDFVLAFPLDGIYVKFPRATRYIAAVATLSISYILAYEISKWAMYFKRRNHKEFMLFLISITLMIFIMYLLAFLLIIGTF